MKKKHTINLNDLSNDIANKFYSEFINKFPNIGHELNMIHKSNSPYYSVVRIPSLNKDFGDIEVLIWHREITVSIGDKFHTHFDINLSGEDSTINDSKQVICEVISFLEDVINDKILLRVRMKGKRIISSSIVDVDDTNKSIESMAKLIDILSSIFQKESRTFLYSWSGNQIEIE